jgi:hypothetical protein
LCCMKIQNDFSEYFETRQRLRQGDVLLPLIFNVVLESIVKLTNERHYIQQANTNTWLCR